MTETVETKKKTRNPLTGISRGIMIEAAVVFVLQILRCFFTKPYIELGAIALIFGAWLIIFFSANSLPKKNRELLKAWIGAIVGLIFVFLEGAMLGKDLYSGMGKDSYVDVYVQFFSFAASITLLYVLKKFYNALAPEGQLGGKWALVVTAVIISLIAAPMMMILPKMYTWIGTAIFALIGVAGKFYGVSYLTNKVAIANAKKKKAGKKKEPPEKEKKVKKRTKAKPGEAVAEAQNVEPIVENTKPRGKHEKSKNVGVDTQRFEKIKEIMEEDHIKGPRSRRNSSRGGAHSKR